MARDAGGRIICVVAVVVGIDIVDAVADVVGNDIVDVAGIDVVDAVVDVAIDVIFATRELRTKR